MTFCLATYPDTLITSIERHRVNIKPWSEEALNNITRQTKNKKFSNCDSVSFTDTELNLGVSSWESSLTHHDFFFGINFCFSSYLFVGKNMHHPQVRFSSNLWKPIVRRASLTRRLLELTQLKMATTANVFNSVSLTGTGLMWFALFSRFKQNCYKLVPSLHKMILG